MRPADRLFDIVLALGRGKVLTARQLAERYGVSERTIYRDVADLQRSGVPVDGEAGVGYRLRRDYQVPPMMFDTEELQVLAFGAEVALTHGDPGMKQAADRLLAKVDAALPARLRPELNARSLHVMSRRDVDAASESLGVAREAINRRRRLYLDYSDAQEQVTERIIWPLSLAFWGTTWTLGGWCELRQAFRNFRVDRIHGARALASEFPDQPGRRLEDYIRAVEGDHC